MKNANRVEVQCGSGLRCVVASVAVFTWGLTSGIANADIYQFIAEDGTPHFSDQPTDSRYQLMLLTGSGSPGTPTPRLSRSQLEARQSLANEIARTALTHRVDAALLHAVIEVESGYNTSAVSPKGALGLMQLMPDTARRYGVLNPMDAVQNLHGGARLLRDLLDQFGGSKELALAAYNAGAGAVMHYGRRIPPFAETRLYVPAVLRRYELQLSQAAPATK